MKLSKRTAVRGGKAVDMTIQEFELLEVLIQNRNIALSRENLIEKGLGL